MRDFVYPAQTQTQSLGRLGIKLNSQANLRPIENATIRISYTGDPTNIIEEVRTNNVGRTPDRKSVV